MKKMREWFSPNGENQNLRLKLRKMKLTFIFSMLVLLSFGNGFSQAKVSIHFEKVNIQQVMQTLEEQTGYVFLYKDGILDLERHYSVSFTNEPVEEVLAWVCESAGVEYEIRSDRQILLKEKPTESIKSLARQPQKKITGIVTDRNGYPIPGVTVVEKNTTNGTITGPDGKFSISVSRSEERRVGKECRYRCAT